MSVLLLLALACGPDPSPFGGVSPPGRPDSALSPGESGEGADTPGGADSGWSPPAVPDPRERYRFAVIGDYGSNDEYEAAVAAAVLRWEPDFILTLGDNNYSSEEGATDAAIGQYYGSYIHPYAGKYGAGAKENRFWPSPGNSDWSIDDLEPYLAYFELPGNERYYELRYEDLHLFALDSDSSEPDGTTADSVQGQWLKQALAASDAAWQIAYFHHPPYSSGSHDDNESLQWPFAAWGADAVLAGHDHIYERQVHDGVPFLIEGRGGRSLYSISATPDARSQVSFNEEHGALLIKVQETFVQYEAWTASDGLVDLFRVRPGQPLGAAVRLLHQQSDWSWTITDPGAGWAAPEFAAEGWSAGEAPLAIAAATAWARQRFVVPDPERIQSLTLELRALDGAIVYLNGQEIHRVNLPKGDIAAGEPALAPGATDAATLAVPAAALVAGENVLAVEIHRAAAEKDGVELLAGLAGSGGEPLLASGASWRVWYSAAPPAEGWRNLYFSDTSWSGALTPLGFGRDGAATTIAGSSADPQTALYARAVFTADANVEDLLLRVARADGCVVYLNGVEILRSNLSLKGAAQAEIDDGWEPLLQETLVDPRLLQDGENVLSAVVYRAPDSAEMWFDLELIGLP